MAYGRMLGAMLPIGSVLCLHGDLAAGKTTFVKGLAEALGVSSDEVNSPTFVYLNIYRGCQNIYHFDLYRMTKSEQFLQMGFDEYLFSDGLTCIEWSERIADYLPKHAIKVTLNHSGEDKREIIVEGLDGALSVQERQIY